LPYSIFPLPQAWHLQGLVESKSIIGTQIKRNSPPVRIVKRHPQPELNVCLVCNLWSLHRLQNRLVC